MKPHINLIIAMSKNRVIGKNNQLPWHIKEDLMFFKEMTVGHTVIMGYQTFVSLGQTPLPNRKNVVISNKKSVINKDSVQWVESLDVALKTNPSGSIFIIGGLKTYKAALSYANNIFLTLIHKEYEGDTLLDFINKDFTIPGFQLLNQPIRPSIITEEQIKLEFLVYKSIKNR